MSPNPPIPGELRAAAKLAAKLTASPEPVSAAKLSQLSEELTSLIAESDSRVSAETGFSLSGPTRPRVLTRSEWASANVDSMLQLMAPLVNRPSRARRMPASSAVRLFSGQVLGMQIGGVLGLLSRRVLGQYDVLSEADEVWFVGSNILMMESKFGFVPRDFRLWVAVHELTHRAQFDAHPWLKDHFVESVEDFLQKINVDARSVLRRLREAISGSNAELPLGLRFLEASQRDQFERLQALMSLIEGHANFVMDRVAEDLIPSHKRMRAAFNSGTAFPGLPAKLLYRLLGLDVKKRQYREGQDFVTAIHAAGGTEAVARTFSSPDALPTLKEIRSPEGWLTRVA